MKKKRTNKYIFIPILLTVSAFMFCDSKVNQSIQSNHVLKGYQLSNVTSFVFQKQQKDSVSVTFSISTLEDSLHNCIAFHTVNIERNNDTISMYPLDSVYSDSINDSLLFSKTHFVRYVFQNIGNKRIRLFQIRNADTVYFEDSLEIVVSSPDTSMKPLDISDLPTHPKQ